MLPEIKQYHAELADLHQQVTSIIKPLDTKALNWRPIDGDEEFATNSLAVLAAHIAGSEHFWIGELIGRLAPTRDRDAEFAKVANSAGELIAALEKVAKESSNILSVLTEEEIDADREVRGENVSLRWVIIHVIHHTSLHIGHMQMTIQLWNYGNSNPSSH